MSAHKKKVYSVVLIWSVTAIIALTVALIIGNALKKASDKIPEYTEGSLEIYQYTGQDVPPVNAIMLDLSGETDSTIENTVKSLPSDTSAVSLYLRTASGVTAYRSDVALAVVGNAGGSIDLVNLVELLHSKDIYVSVCFFVNSPNTKSGAGFDAAVQYESALISEVLSTGVDDIILTGLPSDSDGIAKASLLFSEIRKACADTAFIGASIKYTTMISDSGALALTGYLSFADFCAIDTDGTKAAGIHAQEVVQTLSYHFSAYPLRLLVETYGESDRASTISALNSLGICNIQEHKSATALAPMG